jgi:hypothetical protein
MTVGKSKHCSSRITLKYTLLDIPEWIGEGAARNCTTNPNTGAETLQKRAINSVGDLDIYALAGQWSDAHKTNLISPKVLGVRGL